MVLNKNLDLLGVNPNGYQVSFMQWVLNLFIWIVIIGTVVELTVWKKELGKELISYGSVFLICIQMVVMVFLLITAPKRLMYGNCYKQGFLVMSSTRCLRMKMLLYLFLIILVAYI